MRGSKGRRKTFYNGKRRDINAEIEASDRRNKKIAERIAREQGGGVEQNGSTFWITSPEQSDSRTIGPKNPE